MVCFPRVLLVGFSLVACRNFRLLFDCASRLNRNLPGSLQEQALAVHKCSLTALAEASTPTLGVVVGGFAACLLWFVVWLVPVLFCCWRVVGSRGGFVRTWPVFFAGTFSHSDLVSFAGTYLFHPIQQPGPSILEGRANYKAATLCALLVTNYCVPAVFSMSTF